LTQTLFSFLCGLSSSQADSSPLPRASRDVLASPTRSWRPSLRGSPDRAHWPRLSLPARPQTRLCPALSAYSPILCPIRAFDPSSSALSLSLSLLSHERLLFSFRTNEQSLSMPTPRSRCLFTRRLEHHHARRRPHCFLFEVTRQEFSLGWRKLSYYSRTAQMYSLSKMLVLLYWEPFPAEKNRRR
jgi:hypothetical protein